MIEPQPTAERAVVVTTATTADRARVLATVIAAFRADPAMRYFFPDDASYADEVAAFAGYLFDRRVGHGGVFVADGGASVAMWDLPDTGTAEVPYATDMPLSETARQRLDAYDGAVHAVLPDGAYWYLGVLATHPEHAGRRLARAVMAEGLRRAGTAGLPAFLETSNPNNVEVYRRAGWRVKHTLRVAALPIWVMSHPGG